MIPLPPGHTRPPAPPLSADQARTVARFDAAEMPAEVLVEQAGRRYWNDAEFHARVKLVASYVERGQPDDGFDRFHRDSVVIGAAVALHLADRNPPAAVLAADPEPRDAVIERMARAMWEAERGSLALDWAEIVESARVEYRRRSAVALDASRGGTQ